MRGSFIIIIQSNPLTFQFFPALQSLTQFGYDVKHSTGDRLRSCTDLNQSTKAFAIQNKQRRSAPK